MKTIISIIAAALLPLACPALTISFTGQVTRATDGWYHFKEGDTFTGWLNYDASLSRNNGLAGAGVSVNNGTPPIMFMPDLCQLTVIAGGYYLLGNPMQFWGGFTVFVDDVGAVTGGSVGFNSEANRGNGSFSGLIHPSASAVASAQVPDNSTTLILLLIGALLVSTVAFDRNHQPKGSV